MKKLVAFIMVLILIFSMCACNNTQLPDDDNKKSQSENNQQTPNDDNPTDTKYKLTVIDYWGYLVKPLDESYEVGKEVEVTLAFLSGPSVGIELNGGQTSCQSASKTSCSVANQQCEQLKKSK